MDSESSSDCLQDLRLCVLLQLVWLEKDPWSDFASGSLLWRQLPPLLLGLAPANMDYTAGENIDFASCSGSCD